MQKSIVVCLFILAGISLADNNIKGSRSTLIAGDLYAKKTEKIEDASDHLRPIYSSMRRLSDVSNRGIEIVYREKTKIDKAGFITVEPGGRLVIALSGPLNVKTPVLKWQSKGAIKLAAVQIGTSETIELGETLLWDKSDIGKENELRRRHLSLRGFTTRHAGRRKWPLPHYTTNGLFFITITPAQSHAICIKDIAFCGRELVPIKPFKAEYSCQSKIVSKDCIEQVVWDLPGIKNRWWAEELLPKGRSIEMEGIPFTICPVVLGSSCNSIGISLNRKVGLFHFAHCAGERNSPWMGTYLIVYSDNSTEAVFSVLRWNCGVFQSDWLKRGRGDYTWWGPPGFSWADVYRVPLYSKQGSSYSWNSIYISTVINPHPEKKVKEILAYVPSNKPDFALLGISLTPPENAFLGLVEPKNGVIEPDVPFRASVMRWSAQPSHVGKVQKKFEMVKPDKASTLGEVELENIGRFTFGSVVFTPSATIMEPGPVRLVCDGVSSSLLGWMPPALATDNANYWTMIAGGAESLAEYERIRRLGYDAVKVHIGWSNSEEPEPGKFNFKKWHSRFNRIRNSGLKIGIRNKFGAGPDWLQKQTKPLKSVHNGKVGMAKKPSLYDPADPAYRKSLIDYYREIGRLAAQYPEVISINANYGVRFSPGTFHAIRKLNFGDYQLPAFREYLKKTFSLDQINQQTGKNFNSYEEITPQVVINDKSGFLLNEYTRHYLSLSSSLQWEVARAIRENSKAHLTFNHPFHITERVRTGLCLEEYLKIGRDMGPGSPFHETSDRYCLSFCKWLTAKQSLKLPYGDEGNQNPPTYEHNILSYQWMMWMQCWDSLYCQWSCGRPGSQNIAWIKPYFRLIFNAEYMPDPITLALSFESLHESPDVIKQKLHATTLGHYGLANTLLCCNLNAKCYMMDAFPELDDKASQLLIDDSNGYISDDFADRLEEYIRNGGVYIVTPATDRFRNYAFQNRFGISIEKNGLPKGSNIKKIKSSWPFARSVFTKIVGKGKIVLFDKKIYESFSPSLPVGYKEWIRNLLCSLGNFRPLVSSDTPGVFVAPYRAADGSVLVLVMNANSIAKKAIIRLRNDTVKAKMFTDLGLGRCSKAENKDGYYLVSTVIEPLACTVLRFNSD